MQWIKRAWAGEEKLWKVFWVYGVVLAAIIYAVTLFIEKFVTLGHHSFETWGYWCLFGVIYISLSVIGLICWCIAIWKCARNTSITLFVYLGKFFSGIVIVLIISLSKEVLLPIIIPMSEVGIDVINHPAEAHACTNQPEASTRKIASQYFQHLHECVQQRIAKQQ